MVFSILELIDVVLMTLIVGYLFKDVFKLPKKSKVDILDYYRAKSSSIWNIKWSDFLWACALIAPSIIIHEVAHKFSALGFGHEATFHAACSTADLVAGGSLFNFACNIQILAVVLKTLGYGFVIFIPAFVAISGNVTHIQHVLISFAGPAVHLVFWLGSAYLLKDAARVRRWPERKRIFMFFFKKINMFLFILNMIPIPGFDGFWVFYHLFKAVV